MADFEITFTFAIAMPPPKKESKNKKQTPKKKPKKDFKEMESQEEQTTFKIDSKPFEYIHVNYTIVPKLLEYEFDVVIWGSVAKVYTSGICKAIKTIMSNEGRVAWISFSICHHTALTISELESLHGNDVVFKIECGAKKVGQRAKGDKPKLFQIIQENEDAENQPDNVLFMQLEEVITTSKSKPNRPTIASEPNTETEKSILCGYPSAGHVKRVEKYIEIYSGEKLETLLPKTDEKIEKDAKPLNKRKENKKERKAQGGKGKEGKGKEGKGKDRKGKEGKGKEGKGKSTGKSKSKNEKINTQIAFRGELFFTDLKEISSQVECLTLTIPYASVTSSVVNLLTEEQEIHMNPTIVRIEKLVCLPVKDLLAHKYKNVFFKIHLYGDMEIITVECPLAHEMMMHDTHAVILLPERQKAYLQQLQTGLFHIEIYGTRDETPRGDPTVFGEDGNSLYTRSFKSTSASFCHRVKYAWDWGKTTLLAVAQFDPYLILHDHLHLENWVKVKPPPHGNHLLCEGDLSRCCLKIVVKQRRSLKEPLMQGIARGNHFNRMCIICKDHIQASLLLKFVNEINEELVPKRTKQSGNPLVADPQKQPNTRASIIDKLYDDIFLMEIGEDPIEIRKKNPAESVMSGFVLHDQVSTIIFLEGLANGKIQNVIHEVKEAASNNMTIHYHSQLMFEERKYEKYLRHGGLTIVVIDEPLHNKVSRNGLTMDGSLEEDLQKTLLNFYRLTKVKDIVQASKGDLFPTPESIANLDIRFGVPLLINGELDLFVPKRLHFQIVEAPRISEYCGMNSEESEYAQEYSQDEYGEEEERELAASSCKSFHQSVGSGAF